MTGKGRNAGSNRHILFSVRRISIAGFITLLLFVLCACTRSDKNSAARKAGKAAYEISQETRKAAKKAGQELRKAGQEAREGWKEAKREDQARKK
jgi:hypothetical protein